MEINFECEHCHQRLKADQGMAGLSIGCPACAALILIPETVPSLASEPVNGTESVSETGVGPLDEQIALFSHGADELTCPVCWLRLHPGDIMHVSVHDSLRGDPVLGEDAQQRFHATRFNNLGQALDAMGLACSNIACPHCRRKFPPGFLDRPHHLISLVGDQAAGKSYFLSVLMKVLPVTLYRHFGVTFQDADPEGNAALNEMKKALFGAQAPAQAKLAKTQLEGAMYERLPRFGRMVALPKPFVYALGHNGNLATQCSMVFYDNAGEHFQPGINPVEQPGAQHVASAAGLLFLFDPFNSPEFRRLLTDNADPQLEKPVVDQQDIILSEMRSRIQSIRNLRIEERIDTPLAVLVGKSDAWMHLLPGGPPDDPLADGTLSQAVLRKNSDRVRSLLLKVCPTIVANAEALSTTVLYFPVSSFGHTPVKLGPGEYVPDPARLNPTLVEAPVLWLLSGICPEIFAASETGMVNVT